MTSSKQVDPPSDLKDPAPHVFYAIVIWGMFLPFWTIATLVLDLVVAVHIAEEFNGEIRFPAAFQRCLQRYHADALVGGSHCPHFAPQSKTLPRYWHPPVGLR